MVGGGDPFYLKFWVNRPADFKPIIARSASAVPPSEKVRLTLKELESHLRAFQRAQDDHRTLPISPPKGVLKRKTADFRPKSHFTRRKPATKFLCVKTVNDKVVRHSLA